MPANRNALIRYKTLDKCLQNRFRKWTLADLIDAVSDALYEYEGIDKGISKRTVQGDIQMMRSALRLTTPPYICYPHDKPYRPPRVITRRKYDLWNAVPKNVH